MSAKEASQSPAVLDQIAATCRAVEADEEALAEAVAEARVEGETWAAIAGVLGMSRRAVARRYGGVAETFEIRALPGILDALAESKADIAAGRVFTRQEVRVFLGLPVR